MFFYKEWITLRSRRQVVVGLEPSDSGTFGGCDSRDATADLEGGKNKVPLEDLAEHAVMMLKPEGATVLRFSLQPALRFSGVDLRL